MTGSARTARLAGAGLVALVGTAVVLIASTAVAAPAPLPSTPYLNPVVRCKVTDSRLDEISGMADLRGVVYVVNDSAPVTAYRLDRGCHVESTVTLRLPAPHDRRAAPGPAPGVKTVDLEDLAVGADGALWFGDIGGNTAHREAVSLYRWLPGTSPDRVTRYDLVYPDGPHDAEALLLSLAGQVVIVTKTGSGVAEVFSTRLPLQPVSALHRAGVVNVEHLVGRTWHGAATITGGAVARDGVHVALRTYTTAFEWDVSDGDIARALVARMPRRVPIGVTAQGEAITYADGSAGLLTQSERLPAPLGYVGVRRAPDAAAAVVPALPPSVLGGAAGSMVLLGWLAAIAWRLRRPGLRAGSGGALAPGGSMVPA